MSSCSKPPLEGEEVEMIGEVCNVASTKKCKKSKMQRRSAYFLRSTVPVSLIDGKKTKKSPEDKAVRKRKRTTKLKRFDKCIKNPGDDQLIVDIIDGEEDDIQILEEDDLIEIIEHIRRDAENSRILVDLTQEESIEINKHNSENEKVVESSEVTDKGTEYVDRPGCSSDNQNAAAGLSSDSTDNAESSEKAVEAQERHLAGQSFSQEKCLKDPEEFCKLFVDELKPETTSEALKKHFEKWGNVFHATVETSFVTNRSKRNGYVIYTRRYMVDEAQRHRPHIIDGKNVCCRRIVPKDIPYPGLIRELFIPHVDDFITERDLVTYFLEFGEIISCRVVMQKTQFGTRRFGFLSYGDYDSVDKILLSRYHTIKGSDLSPRILLTKNQLAERNLKYYLKYFGGFHDWSLSAIENWIKHNPRVFDINSPHRINMERLHREGTTHPTNSNLVYSSSSVTLTQRDIRALELARNSACSDDVKKIKIEINSDYANNTWSYNDGGNSSQVVKEERLPLPGEVKIKTEPKDTM